MNNNLTNNDLKLLKEKYANLKKVQKKLDKNYPVQYLIGNVEFYGYPILVNKNVLIPRFETEYLVEKTVQLIDKYNMKEASLIEIGTGSGCISIALKKLQENIHITAIDISRLALNLAKKNAINNNVDIKFLRKDLFKYKPQEKFDILISNPPYIAENEDIDEKTKYEPKKALYAKDKGLEYYKYIIDNHQIFLKEKYLMAFEIGMNQGSELISYAKKYCPNANIYVEKDLNDRDRYFFIINE